jgi:dephospho-CoA kinase
MGGYHLKLIAVTGMPGSGKEELVKIAIEQGIKVVRMGDVVRAEIKNRDLDLTDINIGKIASEEREKQGPGIWAKRTLPLVKGEIVLIDGVRSESELKIFKNAFGKNIEVVCVHASPKIRYERIKKRKRKDATMTWEEFSKRDERELGWGLDKAISLCNHTIVNEGSLEDYHKTVKKLLKTLK